MKKIILLLLIIAQLQLVAQEVFLVSPTESTIEWTGSIIFGEHYGKLSFLNGSVVMKENNLERGSFIINIKSITIDDIKDKKDRDELLSELVDESFLDVQFYSMAAFEIKKVEKIKEGSLNYQITGNLTIKEITQQITFPAYIIVKDNILTANAKFKIDRQRWNMKFEEKMEEMFVYDDIEISVKLVAKLKKK